MTETEETHTYRAEHVYVEKIIERVILLPQILEVIRNVHHISDEVSLEGLGVALGVGVSVEMHTENYVELCESVRVSLEGLIASLKVSRSAESKALLELLEALLPMVLRLIKFPTIVQVPTIREKPVEVPTIVRVPIRDQESINFSLANSILIEKLIAELRRLRTLPNIKLQLDKDVQDIFFAELKPLENMEVKLKQFMSIVVQKFRDLGGWSDDHSFMLNSFLQERFLMAGIVKEANEKLEVLRRSLDRSEAEQIQMSEIIARLNIHNIGLRKSLEELVASLQDMDQRNLEPKVKVTLEGLTIRGKTMLDSDYCLDSDKIFDSVSRSGSFLNSLETERYRLQLKTAETELSSFRGGESERNRYLLKQIAALEAEMQGLRDEINSSRVRVEVKTDRPRIAELQLRGDQLNDQINEVRQEYQRRIIRMKEANEKDLSEARRFASIMTTASSASEQVEHLRNLNIELESKLRANQNEISLISNKKAQLEFELNKKDAELENLRKQNSMFGPDFRMTGRPENLATSRTVVRQGQSDFEEPTGLKRPAGELSSSVIVNRFDTSPDIRQTMRYNTPADQQRSQQGSFQTTLVQPASMHQTRAIREPSDLSSSQASHLQRSPDPLIERRTVTLLQLRDQNINERIIAQLMMKVMEKVKEETSRGRFMHYSPDNIHIGGFDVNSNNVDNVKVKLGEPINREDAERQLYLAPEILRGENATEKSTNFTLAVIWDELLNGSRYFKTTAEILSNNYDYKVRNSRILPIYKNTLFEMLKKDSNRRVGLAEVLRRLDVQQTLTPSEQQTSQSRIIRKEQ